MKYFIVNNNFHLNFIKKYFLVKLEENNYFIIIVEHKFDLHLVQNIKNKIVWNNYKGINEFINIFKIYKKNLVNISNFPTLKQEDELYFFSEIDFNNLYIANYFYNNNNKINLLEDGTYTPVYFQNNKSYFNFITLFRYSFRQIILYYIRKKLYRIQNCNFLIFDRHLSIRLNDKVFNKIFLTCNYSIKRNIKTDILFYKKTETFEKKEFSNEIVFLNSPNYEEIPLSKFLEILIKSIEFLLNNYQCKNIHFIFHPRETEIKKNIIKSYLTIFENIIFSYEGSTKKIIELIKPKYLVSFYSTALFEFEESSEKTIFLIKKFPNITNKTAACNLINFLEAYSFVNKNIIIDV